uniref:Uncharacterized protein n=1 Tax=Oryza rufipogon TaxID=4529 RepID=A0A0E0QIB4_ORYRU
MRDEANLAACCLPGPGLRRRCQPLPLAPTLDAAYAEQHPHQDTRPGTAHGVATEEPLHRETGQNHLDELVGEDGTGVAE